MYLIVSEYDDRLVRSELADTDAGAEEALAEMSVGRPGSFLLFRHGLLMAWAKEGQVVSYRHPGDRRQEVAA